MHQSFVTLSPPPPTYGDGRGIAGLMCRVVTFGVLPQCRVSARLVILCKYTPMEVTIIKSRAMTLSRSLQCRAFSRALMDEKSLPPLFPISEVGGKWLQMTGALPVVHVYTLTSLLLTKQTLQMANKKENVCHAVLMWNSWRKQYILGKRNLFKPSQIEFRYFVRYTNIRSVYLLNLKYLFSIKTVNRYAALMSTNTHRIVTITLSFSRYCTRSCLTMKAGVGVAQKLLKKKKKKITIQLFDKVTSLKTIYKQFSGSGIPSLVPAQP